ncbi:MAG: hypothetical protein JNK48_28450 [Bryobacterales bacterium]|nr:hypothetical protein [Bryobacterales bacterium]
MAFRIRPFYNLDKPVGKGKSNVRDDVGLVQFFLNNIRKNPQLMLGNMKTPSSQLRVTGIFDNPTHDWIVAFQTAVKAGFQPGLLVDGIIDPARGYTSQKTSITHSTYCIVLLNNAYESSNKDLFSHIWDDNDMLPDIGKKLKDDAR